MIDKSHNEQLRRWAKFCKDNPDEFRKHLNPFLDSQIIISRKFYERLMKKKNGIEIIKKLKAIRQNK